MSSEPPSFVSGTGMMAEAIRRFDWAGSPLGPIHSWPDTLKTTVALVLASHFPQAIIWGEERITLYNDAFIPILGGKPAPLGRPFHEIWCEAWEQLSPIVASAFAGDAVFIEDFPLVLSRGQTPQQAFFTFCYSPIRDEQGRVCGMLDTVVETTSTAIASRRLAFLHELGDAIAGATRAEEIMAITTRMTAQHLGLSNCAYADMDEDEDGFTIRGDWHAPGSPSIVGHYSLADFGKLAVQELSAARPLIINDNSIELTPEEAKTFQDIGIAATICMPLVKGGKLVALMAVHDRAPHHWSDYERALIAEVTERSWAHIERVRADAALKENEQRLRLAMEAAQIGTWDWDLVGLRGSWSERTAEIMGFPPGQEITPEQRYQSIHPDDRDWVGGEIAKSIQTGSDFVTEYRVVRPDGGVRWVASRGTVEIQNGRAVRTTGTVRDVTARREAQERLKQLNASLEQQVAERTAERDGMWRLSHDLFLVIGKRWQIRAANPAVEVLLGYQQASVIGLRFDRFVHPDDLRAAASSIRAAATRPVGDFTARLRAQDGEWRCFSWSAAPSEGEAYVIGRDITDEVRRKEELELAQEALRQSQKLEALGQLTGGVAHDFNNLLTPIVGSLDLLSRAPDASERQRRLIGAALESAERARVLVQRLLAFARRQPLQAGPVDIKALVTGVAELIASTSGPQIALKLDIPPGLPLAEADANQLELALLNLAVNSRDAMPDGGALSIRARADEVGARHRSKLPPGRYIRLTVADTGRGMDELTLARAIEPFFSTKGVGKGTGLGLSMVHGLVSQLKGTMLIESRPDFGTSVDLYLPVSEREMSADAPERPADGASTATGSILLVDDDPAVRAATRELLADMGYRVEEAASAPEACDKLEARSYDAVLSDHLMPGVTGADLARTIRARWPALPVLIVSGFAELDSVSPDLPRLAKPFRREDLARELAALGV
jgi:PAS domain S-box-containing protein